jgi:hypothetical protein
MIDMLVKNTFAAPRHPSEQHKAISITTEIQTHILPFVLAFITDGDYTVFIVE